MNRTEFRLDWHPGRMPLVTMTEVAELAGVRRPTVSNWRRRHADFPQPVQADDQQPLFDPEMVATWLDQRPIPEASTWPRTYGHQFRDRLRMRTLAAMRGILPGDRLLAAGLALVALRHITGRTLTDVAVAQVLAREAEQDHPDLAGVLLPDLEQLPPNGTALVVTVEKMCAESSTAATAERLIAEADRLDSNLRAQMTPPAIARFVTDIAGDVTDHVVYDPAAGYGGLLIPLLRAGAPRRIVAADADPDVLRLLRQRFICHGIFPEIIKQDSLRSPQWHGADVVVADPPFTGSDEQHQAVTRLFAWLKYSVGQLIPGGRAIVLVPSWILTKTGKTDLVARERDALVKQGTLRAVVQLSQRAHSFRTGAAVALLVLQQPQPGDTRQNVLLFNAERVDGDQAKVSRTVREWLMGQPLSLSSEIAGEIPIAELGWHRSLLPAQLLASQPTPKRYIEGIAAAGRVLNDQRVPRVVTAPEVSEMLVPRKQINVGECIKDGRLRLINGYLLAASEIGSIGDVPVIGGPELTGRSSVGERRIRSAAIHGRPKFSLTVPDDLIVLPIEPLRVLVDTASGALVQSPAKVIRIGYRRPLIARHDKGQVESWMTPRVLAALLTAPRNAARASGSLVRRIDISALDLPDIPPEEVHRIDEILRILAEDRKYLTGRLTAIDELVQTLAAGIADGVLSVTGGIPVPDSGSKTSEKRPVDTP
jgi:predicted RNA methylase/predicted DNA-binding transcriptional regulator AlpA